MFDGHRLATHHQVIEVGDIIIGVTLLVGAELLKHLVEWYCAIFCDTFWILDSRFALRQVEETVVCAFDAKN